MHTEDKILQELTALKMQHVRFESHFSSELGNISRQFRDVNEAGKQIQLLIAKLDDEVDRRIRLLEDARNIQEGKNKVMDRIITIVCTVVAGLTLWILTRV